ncbi:MAG: DUF2062 domain-containing protein [Thiomargarita sp.]|nr:DUF2062 domain-containing protein [Thiomargarita sp.]
MKKFFKHSLPQVTHIKAHPNLQFLGTLLHDPNLWHLSRRSLAGGMAIGLFVAFIPIPMQMLLAAALAIVTRVNLPLAVSLVWITNPITMPPIFYFSYKVGAFLLGIPELQGDFSLSQEWLLSSLGTIWYPLGLGSFVLGTFSASIGYVLVNSLWRLQVHRLWKTRRKTRLRKFLLARKKKLAKKICQET